jgi:hypothetical protein
MPSLLQSLGQHFSHRAAVVEHRRNDRSFEFRVTRFRFLTLRSVPKRRVLGDVVC